MFSQVFPSYHPKKGQPTHFVSKIHSGLMKLDPEFFYEPMQPFDPKYHTIRAGYRYNDGDLMDIRIWTGKPYRSKQAQIHVVSVKVTPFTMVSRDYAFIGKEERRVSEEGLKIIAENDGLSYEDFLHWFNKPFQGQIICWNPNINYL
jgi:hypothetical protein